jgi:hypothetical protein
MRAARGIAPFSLAVILLAFTAVSNVRSAPALSVVRAAFHQYEGGPALQAGFEYYPGDTVFFTFRIGGFQLAGKGEEEFVHLGYTIETVDPSGLALREKTEGEVAAEVTEQDKKSGWMPIVRYEVLVPPSGPSGDYRVLIRITDRQSGASAESEAAFRVRGRDVAPSDTLAVRNFRFYRAEASTEPLRAAAYRPGDSVWARFDITGYKFLEKNRFSIDYGIKVLRASGAVLFEQAVAAGEERESFYPERFIPGSLSLNLTPDLAKGAYTVVVTVRDRLAGQTHETRQTFLVE